MQTYDIKRERKDLYAPKRGDFELVDVPDMSFLMIDGHGDPNSVDDDDRSADWITRQLTDTVLAAEQKKQLPALGLIRFERYAEGRSVQILHVSYDDEGPTLERLHVEFLPANGLVPRGRHHEIYLSDARRTDPARLKTILRQPVAAAA